MGACSHWQLAIAVIILQFVTHVYLVNKLSRTLYLPVATICHIFRLKCTKFKFGWGSAPHPAKGAYSAPQTT